MGYKNNIDNKNIEENLKYRFLNKNNNPFENFTNCKKKNINKTNENINKEIYFYELTNELVLNDICPNFLLMCGYNKNNKNNEIYLEQIDNTFLNFFKITNDDDIIKSAFFQILYGIAVMGKKISTLHTNLHSGNIYYKKINNDIKYFEYNIDGITYLVKNYGYLFVIGEFNHAQTLLTNKFNKMTKVDIEFGINYNYDFNYLKLLYNKILKENLIIFIKTFNDLKKIIKSSGENNLNKLYNQYSIEINKKYLELSNSDKEKKIINLLIYYCIENELLLFDKINKNKFIYKLPTNKINSLIHIVFSSKDDILNVIKDNFSIYIIKSSDIKIERNQIKKFYFTKKLKSKTNINKNISRVNKLLNNNFYDNIEKIKQLYEINKFNYSTSKYFYLTPNRNFTPKFLNPMYQDIKSYDYIEPIIRLNKRYPNDYYKRLINLYNFEEKKQLDMYKNNSNFLPSDLDEIMLQYVKCQKNCFVITLWPIFSLYLNDIVKYLDGKGNIYYTKDIEFEKSGLINYLTSVYDEFSNKDILKIALDKYSWSRLPNQKSNKISIIIFDNINNLKLSGQASGFKTEIRNWALNHLKKQNINTENIRGNDLIHINDYFYQTKEYCELLLNSNSINLLNNRLYSKIYDNYFTTTYLKIETYRKTLYSHLSLESINSLFLIAGVSLFFYGFRPISDLDGICVNMDDEYENKTDIASEDIKKITKLFCDEKTRIFYIEFGATNTIYWKEKWSHFNSIIAKYFKISNFNDICWNPQYHYYFKGIKCYLIDFEFYKKLQRSNEIIGTNIWPTLSKDYTDYIMINYLNPTLIEKFIYIDESDGKLKVSKQMCEIYPKLKKLPYCDDVLKLINKFLQVKYKVYLDTNINDNYIKSLF
jgi:hypothetical protein